LRHRESALPVRGADAVGAGVAAADDDDVPAAGEDGPDIVEWLVADAAVLLGQEIHGEMDAVELAAGDGQVARAFGAAGEGHGVVVGGKGVDGDVAADMHAIVEGDALGLELGDAAVEM